MTEQFLYAVILSRQKDDGDFAYFNFHFSKPTVLSANRQKLLENLFYFCESPTFVRGQQDLSPNSSNCQPSWYYRNVALQLLTPSDHLLFILKFIVYFRISTQTYVYLFYVQLLSFFICVHLCISKTPEKMHIVAT